MVEKPLKSMATYFYFNYRSIEHWRAAGGWDAMSTNEPCAAETC